MQAVFLFRSDIRVLTPCIGRDLGGFQHMVARKIMRKQPRRRDEGGSEYPPLAAKTEEVGFKEIMVYILKRQDMVAKYIVA